MMDDWGKESITLTPNDDNERSECKRTRMEGAVGVEGNSGVGVAIGVAGTGGNEMDMTNDLQAAQPLGRSQD